jgi:hypothetical protein
VFPDSLLADIRFRHVLASTETSFEIERSLWPGAVYQFAARDFKMEKSKTFSRGIFFSVPMAFS